MPYPKYYATYCVMDGTAGANPFWHSCLILSVQESETGPVRVVDSVGFYSQPSTTTNPLIKGAKHVLGFNIDLQDSHGILVQEKLRTLDGDGLRGITFEATKKQFDQLRASYTKEMALEKEAIKELDAYLLKRGEEANAYTRYIAEKSLAAVENRQPRLKPFHITMSLNRNGFDSSKSHACKNYALNLLVDNKIIDKKMRDHITGGVSKHAFPRFGNTPKQIRLVSTGEPEIEVSRNSRKVFFNRVWNKNNLYWATPLNLYTKEPTTEPVVTEDLSPFVRSILNRTRDVEMNLRHKIGEFESNSRRVFHRKQQLQEQLHRVEGLYEEFSVAYKNQIPHCLAGKLLHAETTLNVASMTLRPERVNYPFMMRLYESVAIRNALLSMLCLVVAAALMSTVVGAVVMTTAGLAAGQQMYRFFKEEAQHAKMNHDYLAFQHAKRRRSSATDDALDVEESASPLAF